MTPRSIIEIALKVLGFYWLLSSLIAASSLIASFLISIIKHDPFSDKSVYLMPCLQIVIIAIAGYYVCTKTEFFIRILRLSTNEPVSIVREWKSKEYIEIALCLLGWYYLIEGTISVIPELWRVVFVLRQSNESNDGLITIVGEIIRYSAQIAIALYLLLGNRHLSNALCRLRFPDTNEMPTNSSNNGAT
jgi:hypothetical protein